MRRVWLSLPKKRGGCGFFWVEKWAEACFVEKPHPPQNLHVFIFLRRVWLRGGCGSTFFEDFRPFFCPKNAEGVPAFLQVRGLLPKKRGGCGFFWAERFRRSRGKFAHFYYILLN